MATIKIPPVLRPSVGGEKEVQAAGDDVGAVLIQLAEQHPATQPQLFDTPVPAGTPITVGKWRGLVGRHTIQIADVLTVSLERVVLKQRNNELK